MVIKTKYNIKDVIFFMKNDVIKSHEVIEIKVVAELGRLPSISYRIDYGQDSNNWIPESKAFSSISAVKKNLTFVSK
jgi:hypothetical protein